MPLTRLRPHITCSFVSNSQMCSYDSAFVIYPARCTSKDDGSQSTIHQKRKSYDNLARIHDAVGVEKVLDFFHPLNASCTLRVM
jgi:hypothetical protein